jgi:chromosome partitioning protein
VKSIAFWNRKGGVGKTTTAGNVSAELHHGFNVLSIDCDPQANLSSWFAPAEFDRELADVLAGRCKLHEAVEPVRGGWHILPTFGIGGNLRTFAESELPKRPFAFHDLIEQAREDGYHVVILDLAPGDTALELAALSAVDEVVLVAQPEYFATDGMVSAVDTLDTVKRDRRATFTSERLVINRVNGSYSAHNALTAALHGAGRLLYEIRQSTAVHDAITAHQSIFEYAPGDKNTSEYQRLATELYV